MKFQVTVSLDVSSRDEAMRLLRESGLNYGSLRQPKRKAPKGLPFPAALRGGAAAEAPAENKE